MNQPYLFINNVRIYGRSLGSVEAAELETVAVPDIASEVHIARHFSELPEEYRQSVIGKEYQYYDWSSDQVFTDHITHDLLESTLRMKGSKFYSWSSLTELSDPRKLIDHVLKTAKTKAINTELEWLDCGPYTAIFFTLDYVEPIGTVGLVDLTTLDHMQYDLVQEPRGDGATVNIVYGLTAQPTYTMSVQIGYYKHYPTIQVMTAFPGNFAPEYPLKGQSQEEYDYNENFWKNHAFIG